jgi:hypothetical protein
MLTELVDLNKALRVDFTGTLDGFEHKESFGDDIVVRLRDSSADPKIVIVVDRGYGFERNAPHVVRDHINLTGHNPLVGPNDPCGERFPAVNCIYITDNKLLPEFPSGIAAGVKSGVVPDEDELRLIRSFGANMYCYNLVPTMIIAAHAGWRVLAIVVPEGVDIASDMNTLFK